MEAVTYRVDGMTCGGCATSVTRALQKLGDVTVEISLRDHTATVSGAEETDVKRVVEAAGFDFGGRVPTDPR